MQRELRRLVTVAGTGQPTTTTPEGRETVTERLLTLADVALELDVSRSTVKRWTASGALPVFRFGRVVRVRASDLRAFVALRVERDAPGLTSVAGVTVNGRLWD